MNSDLRIDSSSEAIPLPVEREPSVYVAPAIHWEEEFDVVIAASCAFGVQDPPCAAAGHFNH